MHTYMQQLDTTDLSPKSNNDTPPDAKTEDKLSKEFTSEAASWQCKRIRESAYDQIQHATFKRIINACSRNILVKRLLTIRTSNFEASMMVIFQTKMTIILRQ